MGPPGASEGDELVDLPLINGGDAIGPTDLVEQPLVDVLAGGGAPLVSGADPTATRDASSDWGGVGNQDLSAICQHHFGHVAADLLNEHGGSGCELLEVYRVGGRFATPLDCHSSGPKAHSRENSSSA